MKKVAIITITNSGMNFGNRLQNYALQEKLQEYGVQSETIYSSKDSMKSLLISRLRRRIKLIIKTSKRRRYFEKFDKNYVTRAKRIRYGKLNEASFSNEYIAFIAGSDQVWNPNFHFNTDFEFMNFTETEKRFSYAASFGVDHIPESNLEDYKKWLQQMNRISVREESGKSIVKELTGRDVYVHVDPTMLLSKDNYRKMEVKPKQKLPKRYLLTYYLGEISEEYRTYQKQMAEKEQLEIIELSELQHTEFYHIGPQHFLYLFDHAQYICTDSFHGTALSILFERQFTVFCRQDNDVPMNSRIDTLLKKMHLSNRLFGKLTIEDSSKLIDYKEVSSHLKKERIESEKYLQEISDLWNLK